MRATLSALWRRTRYATPARLRLRGPLTLEQRLMWRLGVLTALVLSCISLLLELRLRASGLLEPDYVLERHMNDVVAALAIDDQGKVIVRLHRRSPSFGYSVRDAAGSVLYVSPGTRSLPLVTMPVSWDVGFFRVHETGSGATTFGAQRRVRIGTNDFVVQVTERKPDWKLARRGFVGELLSEVLPVLLPIFALTLLTGTITVRRGLRPIRALAAQAAQISPRATDLRLAGGRLPGELQPLVAAINDALDRLDRGFRLQRDFTADAAHELRTPLAMLSAQIDSLEDRSAATGLREDVERMSRLVGELLALARLEELGVAPDETVDLHAIAVDVAASLTPLALQQARSIAVTGPDRPVLAKGNADAIRQVLRNLAENGLRHAPPHSTVELALGDAPSVEVIDLGPGVPPAERTQLFRRFWRGRRDGSGAGLGLAIVARIVAAHGGSIELLDAPGGGARFLLRLPPPAASAVGEGKPGG
jgi:signal transduction histidine kinase